MEYTVVSKYDLIKLITEVSDRIKEGWRPSGGISVMVKESNTEIHKREYNQAMIK
ncbi:MAG TPA: DUF1737 domain-containing protein [Candidatus Scalindua sp.]|nr:DUF1737 domain-containing protein [Candidatus Scalindua sp.]